MTEPNIIVFVDGKKYLLVEEAEYDRIVNIQKLLNSPAGAAKTPSTSTAAGEENQVKPPKKGTIAYDITEVIVKVGAANNKEIKEALKKSEKKVPTTIDQHISQMVNKPYIIKDNTGRLTLNKADRYDKAWFETARAKPGFEEEKNPEQSEGKAEPDGGEKKTAAKKKTAKKKAAK